LEVYALEFGSDLDLNFGNSQTLKLGLSHSISSILLNPLVPINRFSFFFINSPKVYEEFERQGTKAYLNGKFRFQGVYLRLNSTYRRNNGFARETLNVGSFISWRAFSISGNWEAIKGWNIYGSNHDFSRLADLSLHFTQRINQVPHIKNLHFHLSSENLFTSGNINVLSDKRDIDRQYSPYYVPKPLGKNILLGITVDFK